jgi:hypothetical protein
MSTEILGSFSFLETPLVNGSPVLLNTINKGAVLQSITSIVPASSGTSTYTLANTTPLITSGSQVWSQVITPTAITSRINIISSFVVSHGTANRTIIAMLFRGSTCIAVVPVISTTASTLLNIPLRVTDSPGDTTPQTYSIRIAGSGNGTWYVGQTSTAYFNGLLAKNGVLLQELA